MDLNYLLSRHQISVHRATAAVTSEARCAHRGMANGYADMIRSFQATLGARDILVDAA